MLAKKFRLLFPTRFLAQKQLRSKFFTLKYGQNTLPHSRFGFIISKKTAPLAVERNKVKRMYREIIQKNLDSLPKGYDLLFIIQGKSKAAAQEVVNSAIIAALQQIH